jgi:hypothetical protein
MVTKKTKEKTQEEMEIELMRKLLGSIDISNRYEKQVGESDEIERTNLISSFYELYGKKELEDMINEQAELVLKDSTQSNLSFARGTANGLMIVKEWLETAGQIKKSENIDF